jgi:hypothetical protein
MAVAQVAIDLIMCIWRSAELIISQRIIVQAAHARTERAMNITFVVGITSSTSASFGHWWLV